MKKLVYFMSGCIVTVIIMSSITVFAESADKIDVVFGRIKLMVNGVVSKSETLLYNGTTYIPLREAAEILDKEVSYDPLSMTAYIDEKGTDRNFKETRGSNDIPEIQRIGSLSFSEKLKYSGPRYIMAQNPSGSMEDAIMAGDTVIFDREAYKTNRPNRFDIVAIKLNDDEVTVKRIIGLPGETLEIKKGAVYINGNEKPLNEPFVKGQSYYSSNYGSYEIPENSYFVMGDNRDVSFDSRYWEDIFISIEKILGQLILIGK